MDPRSLAAAVRARARDSGADLVGIAPAILPPEPGGPEAYRDWVASGMHGTMGYMAREPALRDSITRWFPPARSVVLLAYSYAGRPQGPAGGDAPGQGRLARYALSEDYHPVLRAKVRELLEWLRSVRPGTVGKPFVDTSPVLERLYARYAGLGWVGKNSMVLSPKIGSFFFLTGLAVDAELEPDEPAPEHCGSCNRCLEACPTDAFPAPRVLDASRCVAYFTIEHRGSVPEGFRPGVGDWVFGCDACQEVCPWNRFAEANPAFQRRLPERLPLEELAGLTPEAFESRFGATPLERARRQGLVRNALLAMGNAPEPRFRPVLERFAADPDPVLAEQARWSLARLPI
ncbi:MAG: tRNA epoxyqueuosine(34) reductase QueG [Elusimicrobia bacterium]|nr:tRNA epoxyqueuosine(34) reductase QueG [Elusimicrobiota bacterium]